MIEQQLIDILAKHSTEIAKMVKRKKLPSSITMQTSDLWAALKEVANTMNQECQDKVELGEEPNYAYSGEAGEPQGYYYVDTASLEKLKIS